MIKKIKKSKQPRRRKVVVLVICIVVFVLFDLSPFGGNIRFYAKWIECGKKPVATAGSGYLNAGAIHYYEPNSYPGLHTSIEYFCTPLEAEQAGYSANDESYYFPHLNKK